MAESAREAHRWRASPAWLVFEFDDRYRCLRGVVDSIRSKQFGEISDEDAHLEGASTADGLRDGLRRHYPAIGSSSRVDVVRFHVPSPPT